MVTAGSEIMTNQSGKVARGLRTIGANITQLAQGAKEFEIQVNGSTRTIQLWNDAGTDMLNTYQVLQQISDAWDDMTNAEKSNLAITLAKKTQMDTFLAVMGNFDSAERAYTTALLAEGSAWKENAKYMESIEAHQAQLKSQWEQLVLSTPLEDLEKSLLSVGTALLKFANSDLGKTLIKVTAFVSALALGTQALGAFRAILEGGSGFAVFINLLGQAIAGETTLTAVTAHLTTVMLTNPLFMGAAAVIGITMIITALDALIVSYDEQIEKIKEFKDEYESASNEIKNLQTSLEQIAEQIELNNKRKLEITDKDDLTNLEAETRELSRQEAILLNQLNIAKSKAKQAKDDYEHSVKEAEFKTTKENVYKEYEDGRVGITSINGTSKEIFQEQVQGLEDIQKQIEANKEEIKELSKSYDENKTVIDELNDKNETLQEMFEEQYSSALNYIDVINQMIEIGDDSDNVLQGLVDRFFNFKGVASETKEEMSNLNEEEEENNDTTQEASNIWDEYIDNIEDIQSAYETLIKAVDEYNQNGYITASTLKKLNKLNPEHLALLAQEGDAYTNIKEGLDGYLKTEKDDALMKIELARNIAIVQACQDKLAESSNDAKTEIKNVGDTAEEVTPQMAELARKTTQAAIGMMAVKEAGKMDEDFKKQLDDINSYFDGLADNINKVSLGAADSSKKTSSKSKDAWVEAFEEEQRQLKHALEMNEITEMEYYERLKDLNEKYFGEATGNHQKYIKEYQENEEEIYKGMKSIYDKVKDYLKEAVESGYEKAINALKKEEKKVLAEIKEQLEALKKEKKKVLDNIKDEINGLKKQKEAIQKYYNDQIDAIKRENEVLQEQNELLEYQQALQQAKSQKVMVMQNGRFQLSENESAVSQAEQNLAQYQDQMSYEQQIQQLEDLRDAQVESIEARIESLEEYYDYMEDYYDRQIESMEEYYNQVEEQYEKQIEALQTELDTFKEGYQKAEDLENAKLAASVLAANEEAAVWQTRLENLASAITEYNKLLSMMGEEGAQASSSYKYIQAQAQSSSHVAEVDASVATRASGDAKFKNDEVALVGESPNTELVLGSRLNQSVSSGKLIHLAKGSGIVNAESTETLAGLLNGLATPTSVSNARTTQQTFNFGAITLPNVTNAETFVGALRDKFNNYSIQYSTIKR